MQIDTSSEPAKIDEIKSKTRRRHHPIFERLELGIRH